MSAIRLHNILLQNVPASCLIEDWQEIKRVINMLETSVHANELADAIENLNTTADCLAELISNSQPDDAPIKASVASLIAPDMGEGVLVRIPEPGTVNVDGVNITLDPSGQTIMDIPCAANIDISDVMSHECPQCSEDCEIKHNCDAANKRIRLACGLMYNPETIDTDTLVDALEAHYNRKPGD